MNKEAYIYVYQFKHGTQGELIHRGHIQREIVTIQLLESNQTLVSGEPKVRVGEFVKINGRLREVKYRKFNGWSIRPTPSVSLAGDEDLPAERFVETKDSE